MSIQFRKPRRISVTVSDHVYQRLIEVSNHQGRSLSNYASFLLENSLLGSTDPAPQSEETTFRTPDGHAQRSLQKTSLLRSERNVNLATNAYTKPIQPVSSTISHS